MRKLIHSSFELDLSSFQLSDTEENNWFSDSFFTKYSFPFTIDLEDDLDVAFGFISQYNTNPQTYYELKYIHNNGLEDAIFEIESYQDKLSCTLRFGFEQLPSFDKKLSELTLEKFDLPEGTTIYAHAETIITKTWPEVNYNFPQVHVDKYPIDDELWTTFGGILNNRANGAFLMNTVETILEGEVTFNRNIMQPLAYWIYILQRGMADAGYTLSGGILSDQRLKKACLYGDVDYFTQLASLESIYISQQSEDAISTILGRKTYYSNTVLITPGKYNISGTIKAMYASNFNSYFTIKYRNRIIYSVYAKDTNMFRGSEFKNYNVDIYFETLSDLNANEIIIESYQATTSNEIIIDLSIDIMTVYDTSGTAVPTITNKNMVDLTKAVPDITFGDFVKVVKNWFNYDLDIVGKLAVMNPIEEEINFTGAIDMQFSETKKPLRKFNQGTSFLLKFEDVDNKDYNFLPVFHSQNGVVNSNYVENDKTTTIEINALPLPLLTKNDIQTAYALESNNAKVYLVKYDGLVNNNNYAQSTAEYLVPAVHKASWEKWFDFRINSHSFVWDFITWEEKIINLKAKTKIFAYNRFHIIKTINKTEDKPSLFTVEIETETL